MNILLIGNGFDLAHGLPTTYRDFLGFVDNVLFRAGKKASREENIKVSDVIEKYIESLFSDDSKSQMRNELIEMLENNKWFEHFIRINIKNGWIDFESEISRVIQALDDARKSVLLQAKKKKCESYSLEQWQQDTLKYVLGHSDIQSSYSYSVSLDFFRLCPEQLYYDLNRLTRALELYLNDCIGTISVTNRKKDIEDISVDHLISFNYTDTYERLYTALESSKCDYLHGKAKKNSSMDDCDLVLGIDEYLPLPERNMDNEYIRFKKFFQRIYKKTGCEYVKWIETMGKNPMRSLPNPPKHHLYIYGHSLDITDKDVLARLMRVENMETIIFYHSKEA